MCLLLGGCVQWDRLALQFFSALAASVVKMFAQAMQALH
jgi:hypothetical protein